MSRRCVECFSDISDKRVYAKVCSSKCRHNRKHKQMQARGYVRQPVADKPPRPCAICNVKIEDPIKPNQRFCSDACRQVNARQASLEFYHSHRQRRSETSKRYNRSLKAVDRVCQTKFGMRAGEYAERYETQDGACAICRTPAPISGLGRLHVDHAHDTGQVRGLLCSGCNIGIGHLRDNPNVCEAAAAYLARGEGDQ